MQGGNVCLVGENGFPWEKLTQGGIVHVVNGEIFDPRGQFRKTHIRKQWNGKFCF